MSLCPAFCVSSGESNSSHWTCTVSLSLTTLSPHSQTPPKVPLCLSQSRDPLLVQTTFTIDQLWLSVGFAEMDHRIFFSASSDQDKVSGILSLVPVAHSFFLLSGSLTSDCYQMFDLWSSLSPLDEGSVVFQSRAIMNKAAANIPS